MYKILIVDDEKMIREGIKAVICWEELGIGEVLLASSGREALQIIEREKPEILLTDISMAEMTGLEMIEQAVLLQKTMRVLVLTGYDSFEYARKALQLKVEDFLLKPIDEDILAESIKKQVEFLVKQERERQLECERRRVAGVKEQGRLGGYIRNVIHNRARREEVSYIEAHYKSGKEALLIVAVISLPLFGDKKKEAATMANWQILGMCEDLVDIKEKGISLWDEDGRSIVLVLFSKKCGSDGIDLVTEIAGIIRSELGQQPRTAIGNEVKGFLELKKSYNEAKCLLETEASQIHDVLLPQSVIHKNKIYHEVYEEMTNEMCQNISNALYVTHVFDSFCMAAESYQLSEGYVKKCCFDIVTNLYYANADAGGPKPEQSLESLAESLTGVSGKGACTLTRQYIERLLGREQEVHDIVGKAKRYIEKHLSEELSVASIAERLYVSPNYFSRLFKRVTSEGCNEYIVKRRIERACMLLETTNFNAGKIATMVGYNDCNYFSITFKKHIGVSPTHYRNKKQEMSS